MYFSNITSIIIFPLHCYISKNVGVATFTRDNLDKVKMSWQCKFFSFHVFDCLSVPEVSEWLDVAFVPVGGVDRGLRRRCLRGGLVVGRGVGCY